MYIHKFEKIYIIDVSSAVVVHEFSDVYKNTVVDKNSVVGKGSVCFGFMNKFDDFCTICAAFALRLPPGGNDLRAAINELFSSPQFIVPLQRRGRQKLLG